MKRVLLLLFGAVVVVAIVVLAVGWSLPVKHQTTGRVQLAASPAAVFALVTNVAEYPAWRTGVTSVEVLQRDTSGAPLRFRERGSDGDILFEVAERIPDRRLVTRIADPNLPFGGRWTFDFTPTAGGTELRITEDGEVYNPVFRFVSRFIMGHERTSVRFLADVERRLSGGR